MKFKITSILIILALAVVISGCQKKGALEQMGSDADKTMKDVTGN